jgi:hypothetical protein
MTLYTLLRLEVAVTQLHCLGGTVPALITLARCLPGDAELRGNLWPANSEVDGLVDERINFRLRSVSQSLGVTEPLQDHRHWPPDRLWRRRRFD